MPVIVNQDEVAPETIADGVERRRLIDPDRVDRSVCLFDRLILAPGSGDAFQIPDRDIVWAQVLEGEATLLDGDRSYRLCSASVVLLPPGFSGQIDCPDGAELIVLTLPEATRFDSALGNGFAGVQVVDLGAEPLLESEHDARTRAYVATRKLFGTAAIVGELVTFPPGTISQNHHHEGAEHFQYILRGEGKVFLNEQPHPIRAGDLIYKYDLERHYCENTGDGKLAFVEFFIPGEYETVWVNPELKCAWLPTGKSVSGDLPTRQIAKHTSDGTLHDDV